MNEVISYLEKSGMQYFATLGLDGKPKVRPFQFMFEDNGKLWFCTSNQKEVYKELSKNPWVELCASGENLSWMRLSGKTIFTNKKAIKIKVLQKSPLVKGIYSEADNPDFEVFYLDEVSAAISQIGKAPTLFSF